MKRNWDAVFQVRGNKVVLDVFLFIILVFVLLWIGTFIGRNRGMFDGTMYTLKRMDSIIVGMDKRMTVIESMHPKKYSQITNNKHTNQ